MSSIKVQTKARRRLISSWLHRGIAVLSVTLLVLSLIEIGIHLKENKYLAKIAQQLRTENPPSDVEAVVNLVYETCVLRAGKDKDGLLNPSATKMLKKEVGGRCGAFTRVAINLLDQLGYPAHRVYLYPTPPEGQVFDFRSQEPFHVMPEVWVENRWAAIDPLHGLVFRDESGTLTTISELACDLSIIDRAYEYRTLMDQRTNRGNIEKLYYHMQSIDYQNPHGINWTLVAKVPGLYELSYFVFGDQLYEFYLPFLFEQPHFLLGIVLLFLGMVGLVIYLSWYWRLFIKRRRQRFTPYSDGESASHMAL